MVKNRRFENETKVSAFGARHVQFVLLFFALFVAFATRVNLSIAIVAMMNNNNNTTNATAVYSQYETYDWSEKTKSYILSSFFWGYCLTQLPGGQLARIFGSKIILLQAIFVTSVLTMLLPFAVRLGGWKLFVVVRIISGLSQGVLFPTAHTLVSRWAPPEERSTLGTCSYLGANVGTVVMLALSGTLASSRFGWPSSFYISGGLGVIWSVAWFIWGASTPSDCKRITPEERLMIETSLGQVQSSTETKKRKLLKTPWRQIFTSAPFWAIALVHCSDNWGFWTLLTQIPSYMKHVLGMDIKSNALLSALPYLVYILLSFIFCYISNMLQKHKCLSLTNNRKLFTTISTWVPMISLIALGYVNTEHVKLAVVLLIITVGFNSSAYVGWALNHMELSPNFGGVLMGLTNSTANVMSFLAPLSVGFIVVDEQDPAQWRIVFFIAAGYYFVGNLLYLLFGSAKIQEWNDLSIFEKELQFIKVPTEAEESEK